MVKSMTGYGRAENAASDRKITAEIRSVNNRYLDLNIRLPRKYSFMEPEIRSLLKDRIGRGKVDVFITEDAEASAKGAIRTDAKLAESYLAAAASIAGALGLEQSLTLKDVISFPEVLTLAAPEENEDEIRALILGTVSDAAAVFNDGRAAEGGRLRDDILGKLDELASLAKAVEEQEPKILEAYRTRLTEKMREILDGQPADEGQLMTAAVLYADRISTDEETVRLKSHVEQMKDAFESSESIGRKLDFLTQEMNREANTILSKAGDLITSDIGITMKTDIEKIREQIQNIE